MIFAARYLIELPYVLNIPDETYEFRYENAHLCLTTNNNYYALYKEAYLFPRTLMIGTREQLTPHYKNDLGMMKCRTVISLASIIDHPELLDISSEELLQSLRSKIIQSEHYPSLDDAKNHFATLSQEQKDSLIRSERIIKTSRELFPPKNSEECIGIINHFIKHYRVAFNDQFADEVTLYQLGSGFTNGVLQEHYCDGVRVSAMPLVGNIMPLIRESLRTHEENLINDFKARLMTDGFHDHSELLLIRANNFVHKGALRSAVLEASAALESYVLRLLINEFNFKGLDEQETKAILTKHWKFEDRCKILFKKNFKQSVPEIAPLEWQIANENRKNLRDKIAHTAHEPTETEAKNFISSVSDLMKKINHHFN